MVYLYFSWMGHRIAAHGFSVLGNGFLFGDDWEQRKIDEYMNKK
ncbi:2TM domain-containing protein [Paenibacillus crassostreae]|nr:2TM domain-containing protein [Paenibacillus crassostreae]